MTSAVYARTKNLGLGLITFNFPNWSDDANENMSIIDAAMAVIGVSIKGGWENNTAYSKGDLVVDTDENSIWRCQVAHTSAGSGTFDDERTAHPTYWVDASTALHARGMWMTATTYAINDVVYEDANKYTWAMSTQQFTSGASFDADVAAGKLVIITDTTQTVTDANAAKNAAQASATAAAGSSSTASTFATNAANSAAAANTSANNALTSANNSASSASAASTSATNASNSASAAAGSASAANTAKTGAETARTGAETARDQAQSIYNSMYPDAPSNGNTYGRKDGAWAEVSGGGAGYSNSGEWTFGTTITEPPSSGQIRFNNATQNSATKMWIHETTATSIDVSIMLRLAIQPSGTIYLQDKDTAAQYKVFNVTGAIIDKGAYIEVPISFREGGTDLPSGQRTILTVESPANLAPLDSPVFTGDPRAPTPLAADNDTSIATTAFVKTALVGFGVATAQTRNRIVNPAFQISQENIRVAATTTNYYLADQWRMQVTGPTISASSVDAPATKDIAPAYANLVTTGSKGSLSAGDVVALLQIIEGTKLADLLWGTADALPIVVGFTAWTNAPGNYTFRLANGAGDRSYLVSIALTATPTRFVIPIPGDTGGTWATDNSAGMIVQITGAAGSTYLNATANTWLAGTYFGLNGQGNVGAVNGNYIRAARFGLYLDPANTHLEPTWEMPNPGDELLRCQRYYEKSYSLGTAPGAVSATQGQSWWLSSSTTYRMTQMFQVRKRTGATVTVYNPATGASGQIGNSGADLAATLGNQSDMQFCINTTGGTVGNTVSWHYTASARM